MKEKAINFFKLNHFTFFLISILFLNVGISFSYFVILFFLLFFFHNNYYSKKDLFFFVFFFVFIIISFFLLNEYFLKINQYLKQFLYIKFFILLLYLNFTFLEKKYFELDFRIIFYLIFLLMLDTYSQRFLNFEIFNNPIFYERASGPYRQLVIGTIILFVGFHGFLNILLNFSNKKNYLNLILFNFIFIFYFYGIFITGDRMNFILALFSIFLMFLFLKNIRIKIFFSSILLLMLVFFTILFNKSLNKKYSNLVKLINISKVVQAENEVELKSSNNKTKLKNYHLVLWINSFELFKTRPLLGWGLGSYRYVCSKNDHLDYYIKEGRCNTHPHNIYAEMFVELGLIGFILFILFLYKNIKIKRLINLICNNTQNEMPMKYKSLLVSSLIMFIILIWPMKISGRLFSNFYGTIFWFNIFFFINYANFLLKKYK